MTPEDAKLWADRKRTVLSYIEQERGRCTALIMAIDNDENFLLWCIDNSYTAVEIDRARALYDQLQPIPFATFEQDIEALM